MVKIGSGIVILLAVVIIGGMQLSINNFTAIFFGSQIKLDWQIADESDLQSFELSRKQITEADNAYVKVSTIMPNGSGSYAFTDDLGGKQVGSTALNGYKYRLIARTQNNAFTFYATAGGTTAVQKSWGSIKSMFK